jgi:hypothetical protein
MDENKQVKKLHKSKKKWIVIGTMLVTGLLMTSSIAYADVTVPVRVEFRKQNTEFDLNVKGRLASLDAVREAFLEKYPQARGLQIYETNANQYQIVLSNFGTNQEVFDNLNSKNDRLIPESQVKPEVKTQKTETKNPNQIKSEEKKATQNDQNKKNSIADRVAFFEKRDSSAKELPKTEPAPQPEPKSLEPTLTAEQQKNQEQAHLELVQQLLLNKFKMRLLPERT